MATQEELKDRLEESFSDLFFRAINNEGEMFSEVFSNMETSFHEVSSLAMECGFSLQSTEVKPDHGDMTRPKKIGIMVHATELALAVIRFQSGVIEVRMAAEPTEGILTRTGQPKQEETNESKT